MNEPEPGEDILEDPMVRLELEEALGFQLTPGHPRLIFDRDGYWSEALSEEQRDEIRALRDQVEEDL